MNSSFAIKCNCQHVNEIYKCCSFATLTPSMARNIIMATSTIEFSYGPHFSNIVDLLSELRAPTQCNFGTIVSKDLIFADVDPIYILRIIDIFEVLGIPIERVEIIREDCAQHMHDYKNVLEKITTCHITRLKLSNIILSELIIANVSELIIEDVNLSQANVTNLLCAINSGTMTNLKLHRVCVERCDAMTGKFFDRVLNSTSNIRCQCINLSIVSTVGLDLNFLCRNMDNIMNSCLESLHIYTAFSFASLNKVEAEEFEKLIVEKMQNNFQLKTLMISAWILPCSVKKLLERNQDARRFYKTKSLNNQR